MKEFSQLSGPWSGWSVQDGRRIQERITLLIGAGTLSGQGSDADGSFLLDGLYEDNDVVMTRRYTWTTEPSQEGVGIAYTYRGRWDGALVSGRWFPYSSPWYGGPFEMWPHGEDEALEAILQEHELVQR